MTRPSKSLTTAAPPPPPPPQQIVAAESDMVVILSVLLCALICAAGLAAVIRCAWLRTRFTSSSNSSSSSSNKGLKRKALQSLPKSIFTTAADKSNSDECECPICLTDFNDGEEIRVLPLCNHSFHLICIDKWLTSKSSCPSCRRKILAPVRCDRCGYSVTLPRHQHHRREDISSHINSAQFLP